MILGPFDEPPHYLNRHSLLPVSILMQLVPNAIPLAFVFPEGRPLEGEHDEGSMGGPNVDLFHR